MHPISDLFTQMTYELFFIAGAQIFGANMHTNPELNIRAQKGLVVQYITTTSV